jgi:uncharacterized protein YhfF
MNREPEILPSEDKSMLKTESYKCLESRMFDSYLKLSVPEYVIEKTYGKGDELDLCRFTRNAYSLFAKKPELLAKTLNEDDAHPARFNCSAYGKPKLKINMRKAMKMVSDFMKFIWDITADKNTKIPAKYKNILPEVGIILNEDAISSSEYPGMFNALARLYISDNGFQRFIRCVYDYDFYKSIFGEIFGNKKLLDDFISKLEEQGYKHRVSLDSGGVKSFEAANAYWLKGINDNPLPRNLSLYDNNHYGMHICFSALLKDQILIFLMIQDVRKILAMFDELDEKLREFIVKNHARCDNCKYCVQRNKNRTANLKTYTVFIKHNEKTYALCPINHVYTYCWNYIDEDLLNGMILYLEVQEKLCTGTENFWNEFLISQNKDSKTAYLECFHFELTEKSANGLLALVLSGKKRATASSKTAYEIKGERLPQVGDYSIVTDFAGKPHCVIETTAVTVLPFNEMTFDICKREGEDDNLESWQRGHRNFFTKEGKMLGYEFTETMPVVFEDFEVVFINKNI